MRTTAIALIVAVCAITSGCTKKTSLYLEPGKMADAPRSHNSAAEKSPLAPAPGDARAHL